MLRAAVLLDGCAALVWVPLSCWKKVMCRA
uniref:Uncharacterized protein n=1 Tax=Physcomitrium patens TaxID=3218 RepID=A0A2K1JHL3_PHYPA|nr:hypothetical protein PHYPA_018448 [Physcomitrium patens]